MKAPEPIEVDGADVAIASPSSRRALNRSHVIQIDLKETKLLGQGKFGKVFEYTIGGEKVAVKRIQILDLDEASQERARNREENAMKKLHHENVLELIEEQQDDHFKYLVLEWCLGTIDDYIKGKYTGEMPPEPNGLHQMASGLDYIHSQRLVHRDIKPENVLISTSFVFKISDFGFSKPVSASGSFSTTSGSKGTPIFTAPEYLTLDEKSLEERERIRANVSIDIFSLGCVFFSHLKKGGHLFAKPGAPNKFSIIPNILKGKKYLKEGFLLDHYAFEIIDGMTRSESSDRWKLEKVISSLNPHLVK